MGRERSPRRSTRRSRRRSRSPGSRRRAGRPAPVRTAWPTPGPGTGATTSRGASTAGPAGAGRGSSPPRTEAPAGMLLACPAPADGHDEQRQARKSAAARGDTSRSDSHGGLLVGDPGRDGISRRARRARGRAGRGPGRPRGGGRRGQGERASDREPGLLLGARRERPGAAGRPWLRLGVFGQGVEHGQGRARIEGRGGLEDRAGLVGEADPVVEQGRGVLGDRGEDRLGRLAVVAGDQRRELGQDQVLPPDLGRRRSAGPRRGARRPRRDRPPEVLRRPIRVDPDGQRQQPRHRHRGHDHLRLSAARAGHTPRPGASSPRPGRPTPCSWPPPRPSGPQPPAHPLAWPGRAPSAESVLGHPGAKIGQHAEPGAAAGSAGRRSARRRPGRSRRPGGRRPRVRLILGPADSVRLHRPLATCPVHPRLQQGQGRRQVDPRERVGEVAAGVERRRPRPGALNAARASSTRGRPFSGLARFEPAVGDPRRQRDPPRRLVRPRGRGPGRGSAGHADVGRGVGDRGRRGRAGASAAVAGGRSASSVATASRGSLLVEPQGDVQRATARRAAGPGPRSSRPSGPYRPGPGSGPSRTAPSARPRPA